MMMTASKQL